jgi:hypothetical protein
MRLQTMKLSNHLSLVVIGVLSLAGPAFAASSNDATVDPEAAARKIWRDSIAKLPIAAEDCSHLSYPNYVWEHVDCKETQPRVLPTRHANSKVPGAAAVGNGNDYIAETQGIISASFGDLQTTGITSEKTVNVGSNTGGIVGPNEYSIQMNTSNDRSTALCDGHQYCTVWQQFIYATDYNTKGEAAVFMQYWLLGWQDVCPSGWYPKTGGQENCYKNSKSVAVPNIPVTELGEISMQALVTTGLQDMFLFIYGKEGWTISATDDVLDIGLVWHQTEFNVVGDIDRSQAQFNNGATIDLQLEITDGTFNPPTCVAGIATTGETNNMFMGPCQAGFVAAPYIQFSESTLTVATTLPVPPPRAFQ